MWCTCQKCKACAWPQAACAESEQARVHCLTARAHFLDHTARKPNVRLDTMAEMKPTQLNVRSDADASATPACAALQAQQYPPFRLMRLACIWQCGREDVGTKQRCVHIRTTSMRSPGQGRELVTHEFAKQLRQISGNAAACRAASHPAFKIWTVVGV